MILPLFSIDVSQPMEEIIYPDPTRSGKHHGKCKALTHQNKPRYIRARTLRRQYKRD